MLRFLSSVSHRFLPFPGTLAVNAFRAFTSATCSTKCPDQGEDENQELSNQSENATEVLRKWGCNDDDLVTIFSRRPSLRNADITHLQYKLSLLSRVGIEAPDLVKIINCRPRFLSCRINHSFDERLSYFMSLFESKETLRRALVRNPSLLTYGFHDTIKPAIALYEEVGVNKRDLIPMLLSRPTMISRTSFDEEKLEYIRKTGLSKDSKMFKYVVTLMGISRLATIREKVANFARFGFSDDEIFGLIGRSPLVLTLSVEKVQRNMTFILGTIKLEAKTVIEQPFLLYANLDTVLKPRVLLARKMKDMGLKLQITEATMFRALRMTEKRFIKFFINCHCEEDASELMKFYIGVKEVKRLAESSKKFISKGFPF